jgi:hypothetical protein
MPAAVDDPTILGEIEGALSRGNRLRAPADDRADSDIMRSPPTAEAFQNLNKASVAALHDRRWSTNQ